VPFVVAGYRPAINLAVNTLNAGLRELNAIVGSGTALDLRNSFDGLHRNTRGYLL
jgi:hypothetical protein